MRQITLIILILVSIMSLSQTPITDDNFHQAIDTCLSTNPVDGLCYNCEYGAMTEWDVSSVTDMNRAFKDASYFNGDISNWDVSNVDDMSYLFYKASSFNQNIGDWDVSNATTMSHMFASARNFNQDISDWDVSQVLSMSHMFYKANCFNQDIGKWDVSSVAVFGGMFWSANSFNMEINNWDVSNATSMMRMFQQNNSFNQELNNWDVSNVTNMVEMFYDASLFNQDISMWCVEQVTSMTFFSIGCPLLPEYHPHFGEPCDTTVYSSEFITNESVNIFPNPAENSLTIDLKTKKSFRINLYDQFSQRVYVSNSTSKEIDVSSLLSGLYILEVISNDDIIRKKFIKK